MNLYPSGSIEYAFKMYAAYDRPISCRLAHPNVREVIFEKVNPADEFDPTWRMSIQFGPIGSLEEVDETGEVIKDEIFDMLSFILKTNITDIKLISHGIAPRQGEGAIISGLGFQAEVHVSMKCGCLELKDNSVEEIQYALSRVSADRNYPYISLFRHAIDSSEPVVQFLMLYLILYDKYRNQPKIDRQILLIAPETPEPISPHTNKPETIYSRLRNEITHRANVHPNSTKAEIMNNLDRFREIVHTILRSTTKMMWC